MFEIPSHIHDYYSFDHPVRADYTITVNQAFSLFTKARHNAWIETLKCALLHRQRALFNFESANLVQTNSRHYGGIQIINLDEIRGTLGRSRDFDQRFNPLNDRVRDRWIRVAMVRCLGLTLEPVELVKVGTCYYVKDGHHRISVARTLGEAAIEAEVTIWNDVSQTLAHRNSPLPETNPLSKKESPCLPQNC